MTLRRRCLLTVSKEKRGHKGSNLREIVPKEKPLSCLNDEARASVPQCHSAAKVGCGVEVPEKESNGLTPLFKSKTGTNCSAGPGPGSALASHEPDT